MKRMLLLAAMLSMTAPAFAQTAIIDTTGATAVTTDLSNLCPNQVVYEKRVLAPQYVVEKPACAAPVMVERRSHFLRFGLGPIIDLGLL